MKHEELNMQAWKGRSRGDRGQGNEAHDGC